MAEVGWGDQVSLILGTTAGGPVGLGFWELPVPVSWGQGKGL